MRIESESRCIEVPQPYLCLLSHQLGLTQTEQRFVCEYILFGGMSGNEDEEKLESSRDMLGGNTSRVLEELLEELGFSVLYLLSYVDHPANPYHINSGSIPDTAAGGDLEKLYADDLTDAEINMADFLSDIGKVRRVKAQLGVARSMDIEFNSLFSSLDFLRTDEDLTV